MIDGSAGVAAALSEQWPKLAVQRCTAHKLWNLVAKAPAHLREELAEDYRRMIYAESRTAVEQARTRFAKKWRLRCPAVVECLDEAGDDLFTFLRAQGRRAGPHQERGPRRRPVERAQRRDQSRALRLRARLCSCHLATRRA